MSREKSWLSLGSGEGLSRHSPLSGGLVFVGNRPRAICCETRMLVFLQLLLLL